MRRLVMTGIDRLELRDAPEPPAPGPGEVLLDVLASGLGISQLHILAGATHPAPVPRVLGHEIVGRVRAAGPGAGGAAPGELVIVNTLIGCRACRQCLAGQPSVCPRRTYLGMEADGGWAERLLVPGTEVFALPPGTDPAPAVMVASALPSAVHAVRRAGVRPGDRVAVIGLGSIGLLLCQAARAFGATTVVGAIGHSRQVPEAARFMDALVDLGGIGAADAPAAVLAAAGCPEGADVVFESAGSTGMVELAIRSVRAGGTVLAMGLAKGPQAIRFDDYNRDFALREVDLRTTYAYTPADITTAIALHAAGRVDVGPLVAGTVAPEEVPGLVARLRREGTGGRRYAIRF